MIGEVFVQHPWLWPLVWQSTLCLAVGLGGSFLLRRRAVRAHQILLLALVVAVSIPALSQIVKRNQWGLLVAERAVTTPQRPPIAMQNDFAIPDRSPIVTESANAPLTAASPQIAPSAPMRRFDWARMILPAWLVVSAVLLLRLTVQFLIGRRLAKRSEAVEDPHILQAIATAKDKLDIRTPVEIRASAYARSPVIWCWGHRPTLLIPENAHGDDDGLDWLSILCHELAHAKRRDHLSGLFAELMACVLPWQPLLWWARQRLAALSEEACDDWVIASGQRATGYARTLLGLIPQSQAALLPGVVTDRRGLAGRVRRILEDGCGNPHPGLRWTLAAVAFAACLSLGIAFAQARPAEPRTTTNQEAATSSSTTAAGDPASLDAKALLAGWKAHYGGIQRIHVRLSERVIAGGDREDSPPQLKNLVRFQIADLTIDKDTKRFHLLYSRQERGLDDPLRAYESAFDGKVTRQYWGDGPRRQGRIAPGSRGQNPGLLLSQFERYLLLLHVGLPPSGLVIVGVSSDFHFKTVALVDYLSDLAETGGDSIVVRPTLETVANESCHVLEVKQGAGGKGQPAMRLWFAHDKGMLPMKLQLLGGADVFKEIVVLDTAKTETDAGVMWYPAKARFMQRLIRPDEAESRVAEELTYEQQVFAFTPNVKVDDNTFRFTFPPGTDVVDEVGGMLGGQPATQVAAPADKEPPAKENLIQLRLVDADGRPVVGARVGRMMLTRELTVSGSGENVRRVDWVPRTDPSDGNGHAVLETKAFSLPLRDKAPVYALHEERGIGAVREIAGEDIGETLSLVLKPVCRVHGTCDSTGLAALGMPLRSIGVEVSPGSNSLQVLQHGTNAPKHEFDFLLPPGVYTLNAWGSGSKERQDLAFIHASTESEHFPLTVPEGQPTLDLGVIDLRPPKWTTLIGHPAPEIGPMKAWKNGSAVTLGDLRGHVVWLRFGVGASLLAGNLPELVQLHQALGDKGLTIIAISSNASLEELDENWSKNYQRSNSVREVPFRIAIDGDAAADRAGTRPRRIGATFERYSIVGSPTDILIDPAGNVLGQPNMLRAKEAISQMLGIQ